MKINFNDLPAEIKSMIYKVNKDKEQVEHYNNKNNFNEVINTINKYPYKGTTTNQRAYAQKHYLSERCNYILHNNNDEKKNYERCEEKVKYYDYGNGHNHYTHKDIVRGSKWLKECNEIIVWCKAQALNPKYQPSHYGPKSSCDDWF